MGVMIRIENYMVNDLVCFVDPDTGIREFHNLEPEDFVAGKKFLECLEPVLITKDIVLKTADYTSDSNEVYKLICIEKNRGNLGVFCNIRIYRDGTFRVYAGDDTIPTIRIEKNIRYAHELQHIFKELGIKRIIKT